MAKVFDLEVSSVEKLVLLALADHARDDGTGAYPSVERLVKKTSLSRRGVQTILRRLEDGSLIVPTGTVRGGRGSTVEYKITLDAGKGAPGALFTSSKVRTPRPKRAHLTAKKGAPGAPEPSGTIKEPSPANYLSPSAPQGGFDAFWKAYPLKQDKARAVRAWRKLKPEEYPAVLAGIERNRSNEQWQRDRGRYIPLPSTFLNGRRWEDELPTNGNPVPQPPPNIPTVRDIRPKER